MWDPSKPVLHYSLGPRPWGRLRWWTISRGTGVPAPGAYTDYPVNVASGPAHQPPSHSLVMVIENISHLLRSKQGLPANKVISAPFLYISNKCILSFRWTKKWTLESERRGNIVNKLERHKTAYCTVKARFYWCAKKIHNLARLWGDYTTNRSSYKAARAGLFVLIVCYCLCLFWNPAAASSSWTALFNASRA